MSFYPPLDIRVVTPRLELVGATDARLEQLAPAVRAGKADAEPPPWDDPSSFYEPDPEVRVEKWLRAIWRGRSEVSAEYWRLNLVVVVDGAPVGTQDLSGHDFNTFGVVESTSWVSSDHRRRGIGAEARAAILHLAFEGFGALEALSTGGADNVGSNRISELLGYERNGTDWATHKGRPVLGLRWRLSREAWSARRRDDIRLMGVEACRATLDLNPPTHR